MSRQFFCKEFRPGKWHVCDNHNGRRAICDEEGKPCVFDEDCAIEVMENLNEPIPETMPIECPCGNTFDAMSVPVRGENSGKFLNESIARSDIHAPTEFQCPKCLLWQRSK